MRHHLPSLFRAVLLAVSVASATEACSSSGDEAQTGQTGPGNGGSSSGGSGGTSASGAGGTQAGTGGSESAGSGGSEAAGFGGSDTAGSGGAEAGSGGIGGSPVAGSGGSNAGTGGSDAGAGGSEVGGAAGSGGTTIEPGFEALSCSSPVKDLATQLGVASIQVLEAMIGSNPGAGGSTETPPAWTSLGLDGEPCSQANNKESCLALAAEQQTNTTSSQLNSQHYYWSQAREMLLITKGDEVIVLTDTDALKALLGPIDTVEKVKLWLRYQFPMGAPCDFQIKKVDGGFQVWALGVLVNDCPFTNEDQLLLISPDGALTKLDSKNTSTGGGCAGRRPEGLSAVAFLDSQPLGVFFARMNYLEAASVDAFEHLHAELERHHAPQPLLDGCKEAAADEVQHAEITGALALRFGGSLREPRIAPHRTRTLEEIAIENQIEGCVRETYGALVAAYQAEHAADQEVREALRQIAADETNHATLSWALQSWMEEQLPQETQARLQSAKEAAIAGLRRELEEEVDASLAREAGLPGRTVALTLLDELRIRLWS